MSRCDVRALGGERTREPHSGRAQAPRRKAVDIQGNSELVTLGNGGRAQALRRKAVDIQGNSELVTLGNGGRAQALSWLKFWAKLFGIVPCNVSRISDPLWPCATSFAIFAILRVFHPKRHFTP
jgi:hypothetical protein